MQEVNMFKPSWGTEALIGVINLVLSAFLFLSPWIFGFKSELGWHTSWIAGTAIAILAIASIADVLEFVSISELFDEEEWIILAIGVWLAACPWILRFHEDVTAMQVHLVVGLIIATIAAVELWLIRHAPPQEAERHDATSPAARPGDTSK
jgi:hypothetical protein